MGIDNYIKQFKNKNCSEHCNEKVSSCIILFEEMNKRKIDTTNFRNEQCKYRNINLDCIVRRTYRCLTNQEI